MADRRDRDKNESAMKVAHAPYNFVPFSNKIIERYKTKEELPPHDEIRTDLKTGEIHVRLTAKTPVYISNGNGEFFVGANGKQQIPGSTIRGMVRENMQILGLGLLRKDEDIEDYQIYFRDMASSSKSVANDVKDYYKGTLDIETKKAGKNSYSIPKEVRAGYLYCEKGTYYIKPVQGNYLRVSRKNPGMQREKIDPAKLYKVLYTDSEGEVKEIRMNPLDQNDPRMKKGILLSTGRPVGRKPNHLYVFPEVNQESASIELSRQDVISYREDWEARVNSLKAYYDAEFWNLPAEGKTKPIFYVQTNGHTYFGMSLFLRIGYPRSIAEGMPKTHRDKDQMHIYDYVHAMLGYTEDKESYRSRVSFGDFSVFNKVQKISAYKVVLGAPKPSYYPGYLNKGENYYSEEEFHLRGYKQYWLKEVQKQEGDIKENVMTTLYPLPEGTEFEGVIRYKNLYKDELGLLLWTLLLEEDCYQSIGMGKPFGFGCMELKVIDLKEFAPRDAYQMSNLCSGLESVKDEIPKYIECYQNYASEKISNNAKNPKKKKVKKIQTFDEIKDFFFMHRISKFDKNETSYMKLSEYSNITEGLPMLRKIRSDQELEDTKAAEKKSEGSMEDALQNLLNKIRI